MEKCYFKTLSVKVTYVMLCTALATLVYSCKKTYTEDEVSSPAVVVAAAQAWYQTAYPHSSDNNSINGTGNKADISKFTSPNWKHANTYDRLGSHVVELPVDSTHLININNAAGNGGRYNNNSLSRSWFLILNKNNVYSAFIMTVIADSSYLKGDYRKLKHNTYQQRDKDFSGTLLYSTPTGKLIKGWQYKSGKIISVFAPSVTTTASNNAVQGFGGTLKATSLSCTDWYADYYVNDVYSFSTYLGTTCAFTPDGGGGSGTDPMGLNPEDPGGGGSGFPPPDVGGGGGSASIPLQIREDSLKKHFPCATKLIIDSLLKIPGYANFVQPFISTMRPDLIWQDGILPWNQAIPNSTNLLYQLGDTNQNITGSPSSSTITLNSLMLQNSSQLLVAGAAIHETLHSYLNYSIEWNNTQVTGGYPPLAKDSWLGSLDSWATLYGLPSNYRDHNQMLTAYFDQLTSMLSTWDHNGHTQKEYQMTMLFGLDNASGGTQAQTDSLKAFYNRAKVRYSIADTTIDKFWKSQLNSPNKLPTTGCN